MTTTGLLRGFTKTTHGLQIEAFLGVPYAEPPIDDRRFKKPLPKTPWEGELKAFLLPPPCIQNVSIQHYWEPEVQNMTEDCLYLNLWVPYSENNSELKTIIIFIHGGSFEHGSSNMPLYDGTKLAQFGNVIVANFNYRVGVMGFFSAFIEEVEGNMGFYDQILAMRWIKNNAQAFGGDPDNIVLMGQSAGAVSISGHLVSPLTKRLFNKVILQSGAATVPVITEDNMKLRNSSQNIAAMVGCADDKEFNLKNNPKLVLECLKALPASVLSTAEGRIMEKNKIVFLPRVGDRYLPELAIKYLHKGTFSDFPMLIGINQDEGPFFLAASLPQLFPRSKQTKAITKTLAHSLVQGIFSITEQKNEQDIADHFIKSVVNGTSDDYSRAIAMSFGDYLITCSVLFHAELHSMRNDVYFYVFDRRGSSSPNADWMGTTHFDEVQYVFGNPLFLNFTQQEKGFSHRVMARWVAFAKTGNPNIPSEETWPLFKYENQQFIVLKDREIVMSRPDNYRCEFWRDRCQAQISDEIIHRLTTASSRAM
ncbi:hypothetical protein JTE90_012875 [Oedothorax gibbosus]|uniref:Carboxylic ester hydrolase n=1 Tax=Oedothorax gibbosus TaxID=931172 RepID=A0AAV6UML2_9ARAC|nr:hypothetical protein JTE90_012875 [Oedothorax gibbosus]